LLPGAAERSGFDNVRHAGTLYAKHPHRNSFCFSTLPILGDNTACCCCLTLADVSMEPRHQARTASTLINAARRATAASDMLNSGSRATLLHVNTILTSGGMTPEVVVRAPVCIVYCRLQLVVRAGLTPTPVVLSPDDLHSSSLVDRDSCPAPLHVQQHQSATIARSSACQIRQAILSTAAGES
jgi:hypothetical protein